MNGKGLAQCQAHKKSSLFHLKRPDLLYIPSSNTGQTLLPEAGLGLVHLRGTSAIPSESFTILSRASVLLYFPVICSAFTSLLGYGYFCRPLSQYWTRVP